MRRHLLQIVALLAAFVTAAQAQVDPRIAYTSFEGSSDNLYVANDNGSSRFLVYKANKVRLEGIDMAPVDPLDPTLRRIAFVQAGVLKVVRFRVLASSVSVLGVTVIDAVGAPYQGAAFVDFSPDGSQLLYTKRTPNVNGTSATDIHLVAAAGGSSKLLWTAALSGSSSITAVRWTGPGRFVFPVRVGSLQTMVQATLDVNNDVIDVPEPLFSDEDAFFLANNIHGIEDFDVARTRPALLFTSGTPPGASTRTFVEYTMPAEGVPGSFAIRRTNAGGMRSHFSTGDTHIVFMRLSPRLSNVYEYVSRIDVGAPATTVNLTSKGSMGFVDTRP